VLRDGPSELRWLLGLFLLPPAKGTMGSSDVRWISNELIQQMRRRRMYLGSVLHGRDVVQGNEATVLVVSTHGAVLLLPCASRAPTSSDKLINIIPLAS
jgi:hypothetical protein